MVDGHRPEFPVRYTTAVILCAGESGGLYALAKGANSNVSLVACSVIGNSGNNGKGEPIHVSLFF